MAPHMKIILLSLGLIFALTVPTVHGKGKYPGLLKYICKKLGLKSAACLHDIMDGIEANANAISNNEDDIRNNAAKIACNANAIKESSEVAFDSILVSTGVKGYPYDDVKKTEIININDTGLACKDIEEYPLIIYGAVGFNLGSLPVICGGDGHSFNGQSLGTVKQCYRLESGKWQPFTKLAKGRKYAAGISHCQSFIFFGGYKLSSTEIITEQGVSPGPNMPEKIYLHAIAAVNEETSILTGGYASWSTSAKTWFFNHVSQQFQAGPSLITGRKGHASATIQDHQTMEDIVAVVGGSNGPTSYLDSTELLINGESEWQQGPQMPEKLTGLSAVEIGGDLYTIGGESYDGFYRYTTAIHRLSCSSRNCTWTTMTKVLKDARTGSVAIPIPKSFCVPI